MYQPDYKGKSLNVFIWDRYWMLDFVSYVWSWWVWCVFSYSSSFPPPASLPSASPPLYALSHQPASSPPSVRSLSTHLTRSSRTHSSESFNSSALAWMACKVLVVIEAEDVFFDGLIAPWPLFSWVGIMVTPWYRAWRLGKVVNDPWRLVHWHTNRWLDRPWWVIFGKWSVVMLLRRIVRGFSSFRIHFLLYYKNIN